MTNPAEQNVYFADAGMAFPPRLTISGHPVHDLMGATAFEIDGNDKNPDAIRAVALMLIEYLERNDGAQTTWMEVSGKGFFPICKIGEKEVNVLQVVIDWWGSGDDPLVKSYLRYLDAE